MSNISTITSADRRDMDRNVAALSEFSDEILVAIDDEEAIYPLTCAGNADRIIDRFGDMIRWCSDSRSWYYWDELVGAWREDTKDLIVMKRLAREIVSDLREELKLTLDRERYRELKQWIKRSDSAAGMKGAYDIANSDPRLQIEADDFDSDPWLLNCQNGILDLRTGELRPHDRACLMTKQVPVAYDPAACCPVWEETLNSIFIGNADLVRYFQKVIGYGATGDTKEKAFFLLHGPTANNGKNTLMDVIREVLGNAQYADEFDPGMLVASGNSGGYKPRGDIARLKGIRLATGRELEGDRRVSNQLFKQLADGSNTRLTAREVYQAAITFTNTCKLYLSTNAVLRLDAEPAIYNRLHVVPFDMVYVKTEQELQQRRAQGFQSVALMDNTLNERLLREKPGILRWIVEGCLMWQQEGLVMPRTAQDAKDRYFRSMDVVGNFLQEQCDTSDSAARTPCNGVYGLYVAWCKDNGELPTSQRALTQALIRHGISRTDGQVLHGNYCYIGVKPKSIR